MDEPWSENDSATYRRLANVAVPDREGHIATMLCLLPFPTASRATVVDLGAGTGALSYSILEAFPGAEVTALDGSASMRAHASERLKSFGSRFRALEFVLESSEWLDRCRDADAVVTSLCLHHLDDEGKRRVFAAIHDELADDGAFIICDLVAPQREEALELFRESWDLATRERAVRAGDAAVGKFFETEHWNTYRYPDPVDRPAPLASQLLWLAEAGFAVVDCFWLRAGHAIYGGYRRPRRRGEVMGFLRAREIARVAIEMTS
ncbi:MAG TPA: class I SAM-dependent methyltransferase [Vicinamibacteria bacterium]|nr:class I SAM-dependent methyltransferase [Vicinamibacteria bacterium]